MRLRLALLACLLASPVAAQPTDARVRAEAQSYLTTCPVQADADRQWCERNRQEFVNDYLRARAGEYQGQRNVAFSLSGAARLDLVGGGTTAFPINANQIQACAWRMIIMASGHPQVGQGDTSNMQSTCGRLSEAERTAAQIRAQQIATVIMRDPVRNAPPRGGPRPASNRPLDGTASPLTAEPVAPRPR